MPAVFHCFPALPDARRANVSRTHVQIYAFFILFVAYSGMAAAHAPARGITRADLRSVSPAGDTLRVRIRPARRSGCVVIASVAGRDNSFTVRKYLSYPIYRAMIADLDGDGGGDLLLGVIKPTRYDRQARRRLHVYTLRNGALRSLWLGSRMAMPLRDFTIVQRGDASVLATLERERDGSSAIGLWKWTSFGPRFVAWQARSLARAAGVRALHAMTTQQELP
jgi:hypothetical protein